MKGHRTCTKKSFKMKSYIYLVAVFSLASELCRGDGVNLVGTTVTRTDISVHAAITADIRDMANHCNQGQIDDAREIYQNGKHATHSLHQLATDGKYMNNDITFAFQMYGLTGEINMDDDENKNFSAKYVEALFENNQCTLAVHAAKHMILWMHMAFRSWKIIKDCRVKSDPYYNNDFMEVENMIEKPDEMIGEISDNSCRIFSLNN